MKKAMLFLALLLMIGQISAQNKKVKVAVMDFKNGVGVEKKEAMGLSDILINSLYETGKFSIIERSQLDKVFKELDFQASELSNEQLAQVGRILGVNSILVGTVNFIASTKSPDGSYYGEYNVDVRAVDVESGEIITTAGATKMSNQTYREMMEKISQRLASNLAEEEVEKPKVVETPKIEKEHFREKGFVIRPEVGWSLGFDDDNSIQGPSAQLALGYQAGPHWFFGVIGGYGGNWEYNNYVSSGHYHLTKFHRVSPSIGADIRWYFIDHKYTFLIDIRGGWCKEKERTIRIYESSSEYKESTNSLGRSVFSISGGFAIKDFEISAGWIVGDGFDSSIIINLSYRFGSF